MLIRLIYFFVLICLAISTSHHKTKTDNEDAEFKKIIISEGWRSITSIHIKLPNQTIVPVNEQVTYYPLSIDKYLASLILSKYYENMLIYIHAIYRTTSNSYKKLPDNEKKVVKFNKLIDTLIKFEPLMSCMTQALEYFTFKNEMWDNQNFVLNILKKVLSFTEKITNIEIEKEYINDLKKKYEFINNSFHEFYEIVDTPVRYETDAIIGYVNDKILSEYVNGLKKKDDEIGFMSFDSYHSEFQAKVKEGVTMFCVNFGFKE
ncbi:uncharacterized protein LOC126904299 [Daktulosphaira vitifoliae]|uniref:uncharacterized protein LOC126904299 n=1 Tax=Daktulosphaira vitifoliae TaxID=58002 RepID=UPI0021AA1B7B|nr:uncharacterized protein LOC126904299 [Daktulosphaira vitifoliae]XP_050539229.1 uncharacterized protein LOC126904299 [Daktulosphaira vitifoliae]